jgi:hypothetical protein
MCFPALLQMRCSLLEEALLVEREGHEAADKLASDLRQRINDLNVRGKGREERASLLATCAWIFALLVHCRCAVYHAQPLELSHALLCAHT